MPQTPPIADILAQKVPDPKIIAFDFDGTLTWRDSFISFLLYAKSALGVGMSFVAQPSLAADYLKTKDRGALKSRLLYKLLGPIPESELEILANAFATAKGMRLFRPDALKTWEEHDRPDRRRVIVTASPQLLIAPFGKMIGADRVIGTRLGFGPDGILRPDLDGPNCRGPEKVCRLREAFGESLDLEAAYGDTAGDREMLAAARTGHYRVFKGKPRH